MGGWPSFVWSNDRQKPHPASSDALGARPPSKHRWHRAPAGCRDQCRSPARACNRRAPTNLRLRRCRTTRWERTRRRSVYAPVTRHGSGAVYLRRPRRPARLREAPPANRPQVIFAPSQIADPHALGGYANRLRRRRGQRPWPVGRAARNNPPRAQPPLARPIIPSTRAAKASRSKGLRSTAMPGGSWPCPLMASPA